MIYYIIYIHIYIYPHGNGQVGAQHRLWRLQQARLPARLNEVDVLDGASLKKCP